MTLRTFMLLVMMCLSTTAWGQRRGPTQSPEVAADGSVTFRMRAAQADAVALVAQWTKDSIPLVKDDDGLWQVKLDSVPAGVWEYSFRVDDMTLLDPSNPAIKPMRSPRTSILHIPGQPPLIHDFQPVPHGTLHLHSYHSKSLDKLRELVVYTPPGYADDDQQKFPTLYLQHGSGDNQATWTVHGKAHWILDNLIAAGRAKPMVLVMMDGHASPANAEASRRNDYFADDLLQDVMPWVEANYRVIPDAEHRAIVGLSMGGSQSLGIGLAHADKFSWVGGFSAAIPGDAVVAAALDDSQTTNARLNLLWIACGKDDFLLECNKEFIEQLKSKGVEHQWYLTEGNHSWPVWRGYLADILPQLFQSTE